MLRTALLAAALTTVFVVPCVAADSPGAARYVAPTGEFSIAMSSMADRDYHVVKEASNSDYVLTDFLYSPPPTVYGNYTKRTVEWLKLAKPLDEAQWDGAASDIVTGYLEGRLPDGHFVVTDRRKLRGDNGAVFYLFAAHGGSDQSAAGWQGVVRVFDKGVALVSEASNATALLLPPKDGVIDPAFVAWAMTIEAGK